MSIQALCTATCILLGTSIHSWQTPLNITLGGSLSPFAFTTRMTAKLCFWPPQDKIDTVWFPVNELQCSCGWQLKSHWGFVHVQDLAGLVAAMLSGALHGAMKFHHLVLHVIWKTLCQSCLTSYGNSMATFPFRMPPPRGSLELWIWAEFFLLKPNHDAVYCETCKYKNNAISD